MTGQIGAHIGFRMGQAVAHAGLCGQMNDPVDALGQRRERARVGNIATLQAELRVFVQARQPRLLQGDVVVIIDIIDADHALAARQ